MAKYNLLLGTASGSIGDITFYRSNGKQVTRTRVRTISNPKSDGQLIQRSIMATVAQAYSFMKDICDHSFESLSYGAKSMAYFLKENAKLLRTKYFENYEDSTATNANYTANGVTALCPNSYKISQGTESNTTVITFNSGTEGIVELEAATSIAGGWEEETFYNWLKAAGLYEPTSQLTLCLIIKGDELVTFTPISDYNAVYEATFRYVRAIRNEEEIESTDAETVMASITIETLGKYFKLEDTDGIVTEGNTATLESYQISSYGYNQLGFLGSLYGVAGNTINVSTDTIAAAAIIKSVYNDGWKRSTEYMQLNSNVAAGLTAYYVLPAWKGDSTITSTAVLNNSTD